MTSSQVNYVARCGSFAERRLCLYRSGAGFETYPGLRLSLAECQGLKEALTES